MNTTLKNMQDEFPEKCNWMAGDRIFWCPDKKWLKKLKNRAWRDRVAKKLMFWKNYNDCDNHSLNFLAEAMDLYAGNPKNKDAKSPAVGECFFKRDKGGGHAINFVYEQYDGLTIRRFIEPQRVAMPFLTDIFIELSDTEVNSIRDVRI